ncbi:MAG: FAD-dependent 5-carboxymethylaminomethyl-2-thiouridine(34) oxidoreductase MnmC [Pseudomonadota bacterium]
MKPTWSADTATLKLESVCPAASDPNHVLVIGAGLAGAAVANALAERGSAVTVLEASATPAAGASGNPRAVIRPVLARTHKDPIAHFYSAAARFASQYLDARPLPDLDCVVGAHVEHSQPKQLDTHGHRVEILDRAAASHRLGIPAQPGIFLHDAITLSPKRLCLGLLAHPRIRLQRATAVAALERSERLWAATGGDGRCLGRAPTVVAANGPALTRLLPAFSQFLHTTIGASLLAKPADDGAVPQASLLGDTSLSPIGHAIAVYGGHWRGTPSTAHAREQLLRSHNCIARDTAPLTLATRLHTPDRLPMVGAVPRVQETLAKLAPLRHGVMPAQDACFEPDLYLIGALGGRGVTSALYCAHMLSNAIHGQAGELPSTLHPLRFLLRALRRNRIG